MSIIFHGAPFRGPLSMQSSLQLFLPATMNQVGHREFVMALVGRCGDWWGESLGQGMLML